MNATITIPDRIKRRLRNDRPMTTVTIRMPDDVIEALKTIAPKLGFSGYQPLIKAYIGKCLRADEERLYGNALERFAAELARRGVNRQLLDEAKKIVDEGERAENKQACG